MALKYVENAVEDGYIEQQLFKRFSGIFALSLHRANKAIFLSFKSLSQEFDEVIDCEDQDEKDMRFVQVLMGSILRYMKEYPENKGEWTDAEKDRLYAKYDQFMIRIQPVLDDLKHQQNAAIKFEGINSINDLIPLKGCLSCMTTFRGRQRAMIRMKKAIHRPRRTNLLDHLETLKERVLEKEPDLVIYRIRLLIKQSPYQ